MSKSMVVSVCVCGGYEHDGTLSVCRVIYANDWGCGVDCGGDSVDCTHCTPYEREFGMSERDRNSRIKCRRARDDLTVNISLCECK